MLYFLTLIVEWWVVRGITRKGKENRKVEGGSDKILHWLIHSYCNTFKGKVLSLAFKDVTAKGLLNCSL